MSLHMRCERVLSSLVFVCSVQNRARHKCCRSCDQPLANRGVEGFRWSGGVAWCELPVFAACDSFLCQFSPPCDTGAGGTRSCEDSCCSTCPHRQAWPRRALLLDTCSCGSSMAVHSSCTKRGRLPSISSPTRTEGKGLCPPGSSPND